VSRSDELVAEDSQDGFFGRLRSIRRALELLRARFSRQGRDLEAERRARREAEAAASRLRSERDQIETERARLEREVGRLIERAEKLEHENEDLRRLLAVAKHSLHEEASDPAGSTTAPAQERRDPYAPPFAREESKKKKVWKKPGRKPGHVGARRPIPDHIDSKKVSTLKVCPFCGGDPGEPCDYARYYVEDMIPARPHVTLFLEGLYRTACCGREARAPRHEDRLFDSTVSLGPEVLLHAVYLRMGLGLSYRKAADALERLCGLSVTPGGLALALKRCARYFEPEYNLIVAAARRAMYLNADETGWRVTAKGAWCWVFTNDRLVLFTIDPSRGAKVLGRILGNRFKGVLTSDFYAAYGTIPCEKQKCLAHLLREISRIEKLWPRSREIKRVSKTVWDVIQAGLRLKARREKLTEETFERKFQELRSRLGALSYFGNKNADCARVVARIWKHQDELLTFVKHAQVEYHNNAAERDIRPSVLLRKTTGGNWSWSGARSHEILMTVLQTCRRRGIDFFKYGLEIIEKCARNRNSIRRRAQQEPAVPVQ
jgi:hypothetical protein